MRIKKESERILLLTVSKIQDLEDARFVRPMRKRLLRVFDGLALNSRKERRIRRIKSSKRSGGGWNRFESDERSRSLESRRTLPLFFGLLRRWVPPFPSPQLLLSPPELAIPFFGCFDSLSFFLSFTLPTSNLFFNHSIDLPSFPIKLFQHAFLPPSDQNPSYRTLQNQASHNPRRQ